MSHMPVKSRKERMEDLVRRQALDGVGVISLNRPDKHNAFNDALFDAWVEAVGWAIDSAEVRCILLRGEGRSFSSGRDVTELGRRAKGETDFEFVLRAQQAVGRISETPKPVVAALKGYVLGGSLEIALRADVRIAAADVEMGFPEIGFGILPDTGGTQLMAALAGPSRAKLLIMTGDRIGAEEALMWGIVDRVVPTAELDEAAMVLARRLADRPPLAVGMAKQLVDQGFAGMVERGMRAELLAQTALFSSADHQEAKAAHREGRPPKFSGR